MQRLIMANIDDDGQITPISGSIYDYSSYSISPIILGDDAVLEIYDNDTKLSNLLDENMQVVFDFWFRKVTTIANPYCLIIDVPSRGINMILPDRTLAFKEEITKIQRYYPAANGVILFFTEEETLIAYNLYSKSEMYRIRSVKCDDSYQSVNYNYNEFKYFYYVDSSNDKGKIIDIFSGKCILYDVPKAKSMKILYMSENVFLIEFEGPQPSNIDEFKQNVKYLVNAQTGQYLIICEDNINVSDEFEYNNSSYVVINNHLNSADLNCKSLIVKVTHDGKLFPLVKDWVYNFKVLPIRQAKRFISYSTQPLYTTSNRNLFDLKTQKIVIKDYLAIYGVNDNIILVTRYKDVKSCLTEMRGAIFSVSKTKLITDPKECNITELCNTNDEDILVAQLDHEKFALFSISKEKFISDTFDEIGTRFNSKGFIKVKNSKGKKNKIDKNGNLVNDEWV